MLAFTFIPEAVALLEFILVACQALSIGPILVAMQIGLFGLLVITRPNDFFQVLLRWWPLLLTPTLAMLSALWSDLPSVSLRYGGQFLFTALYGVFLARILSPRRFIIMLTVGCFIFCIMCVLYGRQGTSVEGMVLIGLTGSKNQMAYEAQVLLMAAMTTLMMGAISAPLRWVALLSIPLSVYLLSETNSATAVLMAFGGSAVLVVLWLSERLPAGGRLGALVAAALVLAPLTLLLPEIHAFLTHFLFDTLNKDPTLTGRTLLWERADDLIARRPILGYGYQSVWMGESFDSIGLRRLANIDDGRTFHFHHTFRQVAVDTGLLGLIPFVALVIGIGFAGLRQLLVRPTVTTSFFYVIFLLMVARAFTDVIIGPFSIHTILFFAAGVYAFWRPERAELPTMMNWQWLAQLRRVRGATPARR